MPKQTPQVVKVTNTSRKHVDVTAAGVVRRVKPVPLPPAEAKETGRVFAQGVEPEADGMISEVYTHRLVAAPGQTIDVPVEAWAKYNANNAGATHGLVAADGSEEE